MFGWGGVRKGTNPSTKRKKEKVKAQKFETGRKNQPHLPVPGQGKKNFEKEDGS